MPMYAPHKFQPGAHAATGMGSAVDRFQGLNYKALAAGAKMTGMNTAENWAQERARQNLAQADEYVPEVGDIRNITGLGTGLQWAGEQFVQNAPQMGSMVAGAAIGGLLGGVPGAVAGAGAVTAPMHMGEAALRQEEKDVYSPGAMLGATAINTLLDLYAPAKAAKVVRGTEKMGTIAKAAMSGAMREASTEVTQSVVTDAQAGVSPDLQDSEYLWAKANEAAAGGLLGGAMTGGAQMMSSPGSAYDTPPEQVGQVGTSPGVNLSGDLTVSGIRNSIARGEDLTDEQNAWLTTLSDEEFYEVTDIESGQRLKGMDTLPGEEVEPFTGETSPGFRGYGETDEQQFRKVEDDEGGEGDEVDASVRNIRSPEYILSNTKAPLTDLENSLWWNKDKFNANNITTHKIGDDSNRLATGQISKLNTSEKHDFSAFPLGDAMIESEMDFKDIDKQATRIMDSFRVESVKKKLAKIRDEQGDIEFLNMFDAMKREYKAKGDSGPLESFDYENLYGSPRRKGIISDYSESADVKKRTTVESGYLPIDTAEGENKVFNLPKAIKIRQDQIKEETGEPATYAQALASVISEDAEISLVPGGIEQYTDKAAAKVDWIYSKTEGKKYPYTRTINEVGAIGAESKARANIKANNAKLKELEELEAAAQVEIDLMDENSPEMEKKIHKYNIVQVRIRRAYKELGESKDTLARLDRDPEYYRDETGYEKADAEKLEGYTDPVLEETIRPQDIARGAESGVQEDRYGGQRDDYIEPGDSSAKKAGGAPGGSANPTPGYDVEFYTDKEGNQRTKSVPKPEQGMERVLQGSTEFSTKKIPPSKLVQTIRKHRTLRNKLLRQHDAMEDKTSPEAQALAARIEIGNERIAELNQRKKMPLRSPVKPHERVPSGTKLDKNHVEPKTVEIKAAEPDTTGPKAKKAPGYTLEDNPTTKSGQAVLARTNSDGNITIKKDVSLEEFYDYIQGKNKSLTSQQKKAVFRLMAKRGTPLAQVKKLIKTPEDIQKFLYQHELSHVQSKDQVVYWKKGRDFLTQDKIEIEARANMAALRAVKYAQTGKVGLSQSLSPGKAAAKATTSRTETQELADKMLKGTGVGVSIVSDVRAEVLAAKLGIPDYKLGMKYGLLHGFASAEPREDGVFEVYINPRFSGETRNEILAHEIGHTVMYGSGLKASSQEAAGVLNEFQNWLDVYGTSDTPLDTFIKSKKTKKAALLYLQNTLRNQKLGDLDPDTQAYLKDFDEWFADEAGKALLRKTKPRNAVQKFFDRLVSMLRQAMGKDQTNKFIQTLGKDPVATPVLRGKQIGLSHSLSHAPKVSKAMDMMRRIFLDKDQNLRATKIPAIVKLADMMYKKKGNTGMDDSYWNQKMLHMGRFDDRMNDIMKGTTREEQNVIMQELYSANSVPSPRTKQIRKMLKDVAQYMKAAGIEVNERRNYFPEIVNPEYLETHQQDFIDMMERYPAEMQRIADERTDQNTRMWLLEQGQPTDQASVDLALRNGSVEPINIKDVPYMLFEQLTNNGGVADFNITGQQTPGMRFINSRLMDFMKGEDRVTWKESYLQGSVLDATSAYVQQAVKRAEYERRFGALTPKEKARIYAKDVVEAKKALPPGEKLQTKDYKALQWWVDNHNKLDLIMRDAREQGASPRELQLVYDSVGAEMGTYGRRTASWLNEHLGIPMPVERTPINPTLQKATSTIMSVANVWVLGMSTLTSIADPIGIAVRTGDVSMAMRAMADGVSAAVKGDKSELQHIATAIGSISDTATKEALAHGYSGVYMSPRIKRMNDFFFKAIGLESWTRTTRLMAVSGARSFIKRHDKSPNKHSERFLKELGLKDGDIQYNSSGEVKILGYEEHESASSKEKARDDRVRSAISEFVDTSILRPNPSQRPLWASDPHFALLFHLKSFMYSFQKTILNRLYHEAKMGNAMPLMNAAMYIPVMLTVGMMKDMVKDIGDDDEGITPDWKKNWGTMDYMWDAAQKGGLTGITQPVFDFMRERKFGGSGIGAFISPGLEPDTFMRLPVPFNYTFN